MVQVLRKRGQFSVKAVAIPTGPSMLLGGREDPRKPADTHQTPGGTAWVGQSALCVPGNGAILPPSSLSQPLLHCPLFWLLWGAEMYKEKVLDQKGGDLRIFIPSTHMY